ncbi:hypothetical protein Taro_054746, partial [Colocasia esculenta]|nr:hypothetical protein [Colocasia esculenta]
WFCLWALDLVEVRGGRASGETFLLTWLLGISRGDTWLCILDLMEVCAEGCFRIVFDSVGSVGVVFGPTLVVGRGISLFRCFLVRDWLSLLSLVREAHPPYSLQVFGSLGGGTTFGGPWRGSGRSGRYTECVHYGKRHGRDLCWTKTRRCLKCGSPDHWIRECPKLKMFIPRGVPTTTTKPAARPQAPARVYALARGDADDITTGVGLGNVPTARQEVDSNNLAVRFLGRQQSIVTLIHVDVKPLDVKFI